MKYLFCLLFLFGCHWMTDDLFSNLYRGSENTPSPIAASDCSSECQQDCQEIFSNPEAVNQCKRLSDSTVRLIERAVNNMRRGIWTPITEEQISHIVSISYAPWLQYADSGTESANNMLIWLAKNDSIPHYLDEDGEILKTVLDSLSSLSFNKGVRSAFSKDIDTGRTFLEMLAWNKNNEGFKKAHQVILEVCEQDDICIRQTYCQNNSDIVPEIVNKLKLNLDFQSFDFTCP